MSTIATRIDSLSPEQRLLLAEKFRQKNRGSRIGVAAADRQAAEFPLSWAQQRLWFMHQLDPASAEYNVPGAARIRGVLNVGVMRRSLTEIMRRHESLRTFFPARAGRPMQKIDPPANFGLMVEDLGSFLPHARQRELEHRLSEEARRPFDLSTGPLIRCVVWTLGDDDHVLALTMHHTVCDSPSVAILIRELAVLYEAYLAGRPSPLPAIPVQYADYSAWQQQKLGGEVLQKQLEWWQRQLSDISPLELPSDRPRRANSGASGAIAQMKLPAHVTVVLKDLSRREGATRFMTLLAAFKTLLYRYTGKADIVVGSSAATRGHADVRDLIGCFVNMLPLRTRVDGDPQFRELLRLVRESATATFAHADVPFEKLVEAIEGGRELDRSPLFQVVFNLREDPAHSFRLGDLECEVLPVHTGNAKFDLTLEAIEAGQELTLIAEYSAELFERETMERLLGHLGRLLEAAAAEPATRLSELPLLTTGEERRMALWNQTGADFPREQTIHELFEQQAARTPEAVAVVFEGEALSYAELNRRANRLAHYLRGQGVGPESLVGVAMERSAAMVIALAGVLKAGAAYVPLDPAYPADRIRYMLEDAQASFVLAGPSVEPPCAANTRRIIFDEAAFAAQPDHNPAASAQPENLAYVIYTSGSTGRPKGVQIPHRAVANFMTSMQGAPGMSASDTVLAVTALSFDIAVLELLLPIISGARVVIAPREAVADGAKLSRLLSAAGATVMQATPVTWRLLLAANADLRGVKVLCGGEALPRDLVQALTPACAALWNMYGPTETTVWSAIDHVIEPDGVLSIGRPIANTEIHVLDVGLRPAPVGVPGEIYIGGEGLARGYWRRPDLTADRFVPDPFGARPGGRLYRTGDLGRRLPDGRLDCLGRLDHQVKLRGFRIELGEIEARLNEHSDVRQSVVIAREDTPGDRRLVAYVVPAAEAKVNAVDLRRHLAAHLPEYMTPAAFVELNEMPLTPNGKLDRRALPAPEGAALESGYVAPRSATEELLAGIWAELLRLERIGVNDNFFAAGGHSLLATQVVARVRAVLGVELPLRTLFEAPTIAQLAVRVAALRGVEESEQPKLERAEGVAREQLSWAQQRLWFLEQLETAPGLYHMLLAVRLRGALETAALESALNQVVERHEALRTRFVMRAGEPAAVVVGAWPVALAVRDLGGMDKAAQEQQWRAQAGELVSRPFDLASGRLLRAELIELNEAEHILLVCVHHLVADGWSLGVLAGELGELYRAAREGRAAPLAPLRVQYGDYAAWQRAWLAGAMRERQMEYWKKQLAGSPAVLELPTDKPRPAVATRAGASCRLRLERALVEKLEALSRREGVTLFMTLLAAFQTLLSRYSGQTDIAVGTPVANRTRAELEALVGMFVNTLVLRTDLAGDPTFSQLLGRVREVCLEAYAHPDLPFEQLVEALEPERELSRHPLFQVMFVMQNHALDLRLGDLEAEIEDLRAETARFDLLLEARVDEQGLVATAEYSAELFERETVERLLGHLGRLLEAAAAEPATRLSELPLLTTGEERRMALWNQTGADFPREQTIHELFEQQAARTPEAVVVVFEGEALSYAELNRRANRLAHYLRGQGVGPESLVGVAMERSAAMVIALAGVLKAGAAYVPLDPAYPADRIRYMLEDAQASFVLAGPSVEPPCAANTRRIIFDEAAFAAQPDHNPAASAQPENLAYVIYTSGSTGRPKGVQIPHRAVANFMTSMQGAPGMSASDTVLAVTALSFDIAVLELLLPIISGARVVIAPREAVADGAKLSRLLSAAGATVMQATPVTWRLLLAANADLRGVKVLCGGEALPRDLVQALTPACAALWNMYGPTETTVWSAIDHVIEPDGVLSIGRPIANTEIHVLDVGLRPAPVGVPGEIYIGGEGLARGYWRRPDLTADRFVPDPFGARPGGRLYRTGDLGRRLPDGRLDCLGRLDHQVKLRGFRIELGEIEARLNEHSDVRQSVVIAREDTPGDRRLVAYVVPAAEAKVNAVDLRRHLAAHLPEYMTPAAFVELNEMPLTPNGKLDRRALPAPEGAALESGYVAPRSATEELLAGIWAELLRLERIGVNDNFFAAGGHSLLATQVVARVRAVLGVELPLRTLFEAPTIAQLAVRVAALRGVEESEQPKLERAEGVAREQLSWAQQRLWFLEQLETAPGLYHMLLAVRLRGALETAALESALNQVVERHEALRTRFVMRAGEPAAVVAGAWPVALAVRDLGGMDKAAQEQQWRAQAGELVSRPFDLASGRLLRAELIELNEAEHILLVCVHHLVADGWSLGVLAGELGELYRAAREGRAAPLAPLRVQYGDYAAWQRAWLAGAMRERQMEYWKKQLAGSPAVLELPTDKPRPAVATRAGASCRLRLERALVEKLEALSRREGVTLFMTLLAAFQTLLSRYSGQTDIAVGTPVANRTRAELEALVGMFVNTLVLRTDLAGDPTFSQLLGRVREVCLEAYAHPDLPFEQLVEALEPERELSRHPLFQVMFVMQNHALDLRLGDLEAEIEDLRAETARFDLLLEARVDEQGLVATAEYSAELFERETVERLLGHLGRLLEAAAAEPATRLSELPLLTTGEERRMALWNQTGADFPREQTIHELFEQQAARTPEAVVVVCEGEALSYAELNRRSNRLAHYLRSQGVGPESLVGVAMERSAAMVIALAGVLKAGAAYVPLDPAYPADRIRYMLEDARVQLLITQEKFESVLTAPGRHLLVLDRDWPLMNSWPDSNPRSGALPHNLAYMIYTSGSTGRPKGAMNTHHALANRLAWMQDEYRLTADDRILQKTPFSFDVSVWEFFWPLIVGATLVMAEPGRHRESAWLADAVARYQITTLHFVPSMLQAFVEEPGLALCTSLKRVIASGEALPLRLEQRFFERCSAQLHNLYGPTEAAIDVTAWPCRQDNPLRTVPIGRPIWNTQIHILDRDLRQQPAGVPGELFIGGVNLARGYFRRPELTAERFIPDPFSAQPGARMYRTGDVARWLPDGAIEYIGRTDHQVKIRGLRIELGEIEARLGEHAAIRECAVIVREDAPGDQRLVAYVAPSTDPPPGAAEMHKYLAERLPDYMVPAAFVALDALPLSPNGKLDRRALPPPEYSRADAANSFVPPRNAIEETVAAIFAAILKIDRISVHDNFFSLGGHSLLATQLISRARAALNVEIPLRAVFESPTVAGLSGRVAQRRETVACESVPAITRVARETRRVSVSRLGQVSISNQS